MARKQTRELRLLRKEFPRLNKRQKEELLAFLDGDDNSRKIGEEMIKKYLEIYSNEKHFARKFKNKLRTFRMPYKSSLWWSNITPDTVNNIITTIYN